MKYMKDVKEYLKQYNITDEQTKYILLDIEKEVGHNANLIKAIIDFEKQDLIKRLKRKTKEKSKKDIAYA